MAKTSEKFGTWAKMKRIYKFIASEMPLIWLWLLLTFVGVMALFMIPIIIYHAYFWILLAVACALLATMFVFGRIADKVSYKKLENQPGRTGAILSSIQKSSFSFGEEPVAIDQHTMDMVFRGIGYPGIFLVSEGPSGRVRKMLIKEKKKVQRIAPNVPIILLQAGNDKGQIPLTKLRNKIVRCKAVLTKKEVKALEQRINSLGGYKIPIPKGIDPMHIKAPSKKTQYRGR